MEALVALIAAAQVDRLARARQNDPGDIFIDLDELDLDFGRRTTRQRIWRQPSRRADSSRYAGEEAAFRQGLLEPRNLVVVEVAQPRADLDSVDINDSPLSKPAGSGRAAKDGASTASEGWSVEG